MRLERVEAIKAELVEKLNPAPLEQARAAMAEAIDAYVALCAEREVVRGGAWSDLSGLGEPLPGVWLNGSGYGTRAVGGTVYRQALTQRGIAEVATEAIRKHFPRSEVRLGNPED